MSRSVLLDVRDPRVPVIWGELERRARPDYFLTWGWIENWIASVPQEVAPQLAIIRESGEIAGACFVGRRNLWRHGVVPSRAIYVNATGVASHDELCIEHNAVLSAPDRTWSLAALLAALPDGWDELFVPGADRAAFGDLAVPPGYRVIVDRDTVAPFVDLERVRTAGDYLALLSANTRAQIRRARRRIACPGIDVAASPAEALAIYDELIALHTARSRAHGQAGAFADPWFDRFHRRLIAQRFAHGEIQLLRLRDGATTLGCLYNLIANGRVLFYQSGFAATDDPVLKPGLVSHAAAIEHAASAGHAIYDLLAGNARYKLSLAIGATRLCWLRIQRTLLRFALEKRARSSKHALAGLPRR